MRGGRRPQVLPVRRIRSPQRTPEGRSIGAAEGHRRGEQRPAAAEGGAERRRPAAPSSAVPADGACGTGAVATWVPAAARGARRRGAPRPGSAHAARRSAAARRPRSPGAAPGAAAAASRAGGAMRAMSSGAGFGSAARGADSRTASRTGSGARAALHRRRGPGLGGRRRGGPGRRVAPGAADRGQGRRRGTPARRRAPAGSGGAGSASATCTGSGTRGSRARLVDRAFRRHRRPFGEQRLRAFIGGELRQPPLGLVQPEELRRLHGLELQVALRHAAQPLRLVQPGPFGLQRLAALVGLVDLRGRCRAARGPAARPRACSGTGAARRRRRPGRCRG